MPLLKEHWVVSRSRHPVAVSALTAALMALGPASSSVMPRCPALFILETWPYGAPPERAREKSSGGVPPNGPILQMWKLRLRGLASPA